MTEVPGSPPPIGRPNGPDGEPRSEPGRATPFQLAHVYAREIHAGNSRTSVSDLSPEIRLQPVYPSTEQHRFVNFYTNHKVLPGGQVSEIHEISLSTRNPETGVDIVVVNYALEGGRITSEQPPLLGNFAKVIEGGDALGREAEQYEIDEEAVSALLDMLHEDAQGAIPRLAGEAPTERFGSVVRHFTDRPDKSVLFTSSHDAVVRTTMDRRNEPEEIVVLEMVEGRAAQQWVFVPDDMTSQQSGIAFLQEVRDGVLNDVAGDIETRLVHDRVYAQVIPVQRPSFDTGGPLPLIDQPNDTDDLPLGGTTPRQAEVADPSDGPAGDNLPEQETESPRGRESDPRPEETFAQAASYAELIHDRDPNLITIYDTGNLPLGDGTGRSVAVRFYSLPGLENVHEISLREGELEVNVARMFVTEVEDGVAREAVRMTQEFSAATIRAYRERGVVPTGVDQDVMRSIAEAAHEGTPVVRLLDERETDEFINEVAGAFIDRLPVDPAVVRHLTPTDKFQSIVEVVAVPTPALTVNVSQVLIDEGYGRVDVISTKNSNGEPTQVFYRARDVEAEITDTWTFGPEGTTHELGGQGSRFQPTLPHDLRKLTQTSVPDQPKLSRVEAQRSLDELRETAGDFQELYRKREPADYLDGTVDRPEQGATGTHVFGDTPGDTNGGYNYGGSEGDAQRGTEQDRDVDGPDVDGYGDR